MLDLAYLIAAILYLPVLLVRMVFTGKYRTGWRQRFGHIKPRVGTKPCIWVHGVSLGEINATRSLVAEIERRMPRYDLVISTTTNTGFEAATKQYSPRLVFRYPLDFSWVVRRVLDRLRPSAIVLMELEVWPQLLREAAERGIPVGVANGRVTEEKSMRRFRLPVIRDVARSMFSRLAWVGAQDETYAGRFRELGVAADRVVVTGSVKYDTALVADKVEGADLLAKTLEIDASAPVWVAGSTGPGEEEILLDAFARLRETTPGLQLVIVPRKPERFEEVAKLIASRGVELVRRSERADLAGQDARVADQERRRRAALAAKAAGGAGAGAAAEARPARVILGDTMGELRKFYSLATVVFVGRTLVPMGGSDVMEVAGLAKAMVFGPHTENFADAVAKLVAAGGARVVRNGDELREQTATLLADSAAREELGRAAREVVKQNIGATKKTVDLVCEQLGLRADHPPASIATARV